MKYKRSICQLSLYALHIDTIFLQDGREYPAHRVTKRPGVKPQAAPRQVNLRTSQEIYQKYDSKVPIGSGRFKLYYIVY